ncbi:MAG: DUF4440 domain-containing protein [Bacteroidota bacterium]
MRIKGENTVSTTHVHQEIFDHGAQIRAAFAANNLALIKSLHHPEVTKTIGDSEVQKGRAAVMAGLASTLENYRLDFVENEVERISIQGDTAIEQTLFVIKGTPRAEGEPFLFKGRTEVIYVRYADSPSGWATIQETIQPE